MSEVELDDTCGLHSSSKNICLVRDIVGLRQPVEVLEETEEKVWGFEKITMLLLLCGVIELVLPRSGKTGLDTLVFPELLHAVAKLARHLAILKGRSQSKQLSSVIL